MESIIIVSAIILISSFSIMRYIKNIRSKGSCCSEGVNFVEKVKVKDRNKKNYPYERTLKIGGMICTHCAKVLENNFNKLNNVYANVSFDNEEAIILMKEELDYKVFEDVIKESGYRYYIKE